MAKKTKARSVKSTKPLVPRGVRPPTAGFRSSGKIMSCGGKKK